MSPAVEIIPEAYSWHPTMIRGGEGYIVPVAFSYGSDSNESGIKAHVRDALKKT